MNNLASITISEIMTNPRPLTKEERDARREATPTMQRFREIENTVVVGRKRIFLRLIDVTKDQDLWIWQEMEGMDLRTAIATKQNMALNKPAEGQRKILLHKSSPGLP